MEATTNKASVAFGFNDGFAPALDLSPLVALSAQHKRGEHVRPRQRWRGCVCCSERQRRRRVRLPVLTWIFFFDLTVALSVCG